MQPRLNVKFGQKYKQEQHIPQEQQIQQGPQRYYAAQKNAAQKTRRTRNTTQANTQPSINVQRNVQQRKTPDMKINSKTEIGKNNVKEEFNGLLPEDINYGLLSQAINNAVLIDMNDNEYMKNENIIFNSKIKQIKYFLNNENYRKYFIEALRNNNVQVLVNYIMMNDPDVYENDWKNERLRLTSSIIEECTPNSAVQCEQCGKQMVHTDQRQLRSGDEGITTIFKCCNCGKIWQEN